MQESRTQHRMVRVYDSIGEFAAHADTATTAYHEDGTRDAWFGATWDQAMEMARTGWTEHVSAVLELSGKAVEMADQEHMTDTFAPVWDVTGAEVDVATFLAGTPECMIDYPLTRVSKSGKVITLVVNVGVSMAVTAETVIKRGMVITAFALALARLGHSIEMWAVNHNGGTGGTDNEILVKVKGANDTLDPAHILFAYAHPAFLRRLMFAEGCSLPGSYACSEGHVPWPHYKSEITELPGEIRLPELRSSTDVPEADEFLRKYLGELGLLAE